MIEIEYKYSTGRLELTDEARGRHEFWKGELEGRTVTVQFGKVGTEGHKGSREFKTNEDARDFLNKRLRQKVEEGFKRV